MDATVAWDNLGTGQRHRRAGLPLGRRTTRNARAITKPAMGMSNDYCLVATPYTSDPDPGATTTGFPAYKQAGVDSMQVNTRGGTHYEYSFLPGNTLPTPSARHPARATTWPPGTRRPGSTGT